MLVGGRAELRRRVLLARAVRIHAGHEREQCHRGGVIEFASVSTRAALYEEIAKRLEDLDCPIASVGLTRLERLLAEPPPFRDYGGVAAARNARIASILGDLELEQTCSLAGLETPTCERNQNEDGYTRSPDPLQGGGW